MAPKYSESHVSYYLHFLRKKYVVEDVHWKAVAQNLRVESIFNFTPLDASITDLVSWQFKNDTHHKPLNWFLLLGSKILRILAIDIPLSLTQYTVNGF